MVPRPRNQGATISRTGSDLVLKLYNAIRSLGSAQHDLTALNETLGGLAKKGGTLSIRISRDRLYLNHDRIEMRSGHSVHRILLNELKKRKIGKIEFREPPDDEDLAEFLRCFLSMGDHNLPDGETLQRLLRKKKIESIRVEGLTPEDIEEDLGSSYERHAHYTRIYLYAMRLLKELFGQVDRGEECSDLDLTRRVVRTIVLGYADSPAAFMGLATIKSNREFLPNHSVNVAIYAIALGHRIGLSHRFLVDLGLAGFLHDIGESRLSWLGTNESRGLSEQEWTEATNHPALGVKTMMNAVGSREPAASRLLAGIFEHHLRDDLSGFPKLMRKKDVSLVGKIISLADFYDVFTRPYGENRFPCFSGRILQLIVERSGRDFDSTLTKYFARIVGPLPVGTLCRLDTGELGIVCSLMEEGMTGDRPWVRLLVSAGEIYRRRDAVSLKLMDKETGKYQRSIIEIIDPNELKIDVAEHLVPF